MDAVYGRHLAITGGNSHQVVANEANVRGH